jgi:hypothetical protein
MVAAVWGRLRWFWANHVQKTAGTLLAGSAVYDLMAGFTEYQVDLTHVLGHHLYHSLRSACAVLIVARAVLRPRQPG